MQKAHRRNDEGLCRENRRGNQTRLELFASAFPDWPAYLAELLVDAI
jgi:hypothetical protein